MEDTARHETAYKLTHRADEANPWSDYYPTLGRIIIQPLVGLLSSFSLKGAPTILTIVQSDGIEYFGVS
jgi:hypothetical protein